MLPACDRADVVQSCEWCEWDQPAPNKRPHRQDVDGRVSGLFPQLISARLEINSVPEY